MKINELPEPKVVLLTVADLNMFVLSALVVAGLIIMLRESVLLETIIFVLNLTILIGVIRFSMMALQASALVNLLAAISILVLTWLPSPDSNLPIDKKIAALLMAAFILLACASILACKKKLLLKKKSPSNSDCGKVK